MSGMAVVTERLGAAVERLVPWRRGPLVLLVEDDHEMRQMIAGVLRRDGCYVVECANGDEALEWLGPGVLDGYVERLPALVVSDVRLPFFDGLEILEGLSCANQRIPVILITAFPEDEVVERAYALGARNVLAKPFDLRDLRAAVRAVLPPARPA
jgi:CheY-like chemotaxis protein